MHKSSLRQEEKKASLIKVTKQAALFILIFRSMAFACLSLSLNCLLVISFPYVKRRSLFFKYAQCAKQFKVSQKKPNTLCALILVLILFVIIYFFSGNGLFN